MAESSGFFNAELVNGQYDREYLAEAFAKYFSLFIANGVFPNPSDGLQVFENTTADMNVLMHPGYAWIDGYWYKLDGNLTLAIDPAGGVLNRIDSIMVRWDLEKRSIYAQVAKGTPASEPTAPEVMRSPDFSDLCVAHIRVDAGTTKIMQSMITDTRMNSSLCGIVTGVVQSIDTTTLFEQYQAALKEFQDTRMVEFDEWQEQEKTDFDAWFETIKGTLDGDTAGNLLNLITQETADRKAADAAIESKLGINATAIYEESTVKITAPEGFVVVTFLAPSDWASGDKYTVNGQAVTLTDLNGEPVEDAWKQGSPITFTISGNKAFFKAGGGKVPADLPPLLPNFALEFSGTTVTVTANKLPLNDKTSMLSGGVWVLASTIPDSPKGAIVKEWSQSDLIDSAQDTESDEVVTWTYPNWSAGEPIYCRQYTYNEKGQYNTSLYGGVASTEDAPPFALPGFTGNHAIFGDEVSGRIELYESGDLTLYPGTYDLFLIGGGGSGIFGGSDSSEQTAWHTGLGGGGSGYTKTFIGEKVDRAINVECVVGAGGAVNTTANNQANLGSSTYLKFSTGSMKEAKGGGNYNSSPYVQSENGQNGGSGGGAGQGDGSTGGVGGSDGSNGGNSPYGPTGGIGQGTTTKAFGEDSQTLYAGGGGGPGLQGGSGGGGRGARGSTSGNTSATSGTPNTGSGGGCGYKNARYSLSAGAGGSGLIIIRWDNA